MAWMFSTWVLLLEVWMFLELSCNTMLCMQTRCSLPMNEDFCSLIVCIECQVKTVRLLLDDYPEYADIHARAENNTSAILAAPKWSGYNIDNEPSRRY